VLSFKSEIAQMLYPRLDLLLSDKKHYERRTKELFEDLGLEGETYRHRSARKRVIERALEELRGVPLTTGTIVSATVEPTRDDCDFKIVIHKGPHRKVLPAPKNPATPNRSETTPSSGETDETVLSEENVQPLHSQDETHEALLVRYFHQQFHNATPKGPLNPKELVQATRLIQQHGFLKSQDLVDYAKEEAPKTKYLPASLNGILQYEARFDAHYNAQQHADAERQQRQQRQRLSQEALEGQQRELMSELMKRVGEVKKGAPPAFAAFLRHIENRKARFLETPIARQAKPETRDLLCREYERPAKRLELFIEFFTVGNEGEALLSIYPQNREISRWLQNHEETAKSLLENENLLGDPLNLW